MSDSKIFNALNIAAIQFNERACVFDNKIILADNSDDGDRPHDLTTDPTMLPFLSAPYSRFNFRSSNCVWQARCASA